MDFLGASRNEWFFFQIFFYVCKFHQRFFFLKKVKCEPDVESSSGIERKNRAFLFFEMLGN